jgi:hypothetical protein
MCGLHAPLFEYILGTSGRRRGRVASAFRAVPSGVIPVCGARRFNYGIAAPCKRSTVHNSKCFPLNGVSSYLEFGGGAAGLDSGRTQVAPSGLLGLS